MKSIRQIEETSLATALKGFYSKNKEERINMNGYQRKRILEALDNEDKLTDWEWDFINSLANKEEERSDYDLSDKQNEVLNRISQKFA